MELNGLSDGRRTGGQAGRTNVQTDILSGQMSERVEAVDRLTSCCCLPLLHHGFLFIVELELKTDFHLAGCIKLYSRTSSGRKLHIMGVSLLNMIDISGRFAGIYIREIIIYNIYSQWYFSPEQTLAPRTTITFISSAIISGQLETRNPRADRSIAHTGHQARRQSRSVGNLCKPLDGDSSTTGQQQRVAKIVCLL